MEFPFVGLVEKNSSSAPTDAGGSLYSRQPATCALYVGVLGLSVVVGTLGNLIVVTTVIVKQVRSRRTTGNDVGRVFIANLALSDLIVTSVINPVAVAGL